jgi:hypothetical protein
VVSRNQIERLTERIDAITARFAPKAPPMELWLVEGDRAWLRDDNLKWTGDHKPDPEQGISYAALEKHLEERQARYASVKGMHHAVVRLVHANDGRPADCCSPPDGACFVIHGDCGAPGR